MTDIEDFEVQKIDPNDPLLEPCRRLIQAEIQKAKAGEELYTLVMQKGITNRIILLNNKPYILSVFEQSLPDDMREANEIYRDYKGARRATIEAMTPEVRTKFEEAKKLRFSKISPLLRKLWNELLFMFGVEVPPTPKKASSGKETPAASPASGSLEVPPSPASNGKKISSVSVDKDLDEVTTVFSKTLNVSNSVSSLGATVYEQDTETGEIIKGLELGEVGGDYDNADEETEKKYLSRDERNTRKVFLNKCIDYLTERLDKIIEEVGVEGLSRVSLNEPFTIHDYILKDVLENVNVENPLLLDETEIN